MAIYIQNGDALDHLAAVEGTEWASRQDRPGPYTLAGFRIAWNEQCTYLGDADYVTINGNATIYGREGYSRYVVRADGEIVLLGWSAREEVRERARQAGIRVVSEQVA